MRRRGVLPGLKLKNFRQVLPIVIKPLHFRPPLTLALNTLANTVLRLSKSIFAIHGRRSIAGMRIGRYRSLMFQITLAW